jgi:hypothetical protein
VRWWLARASDSRMWLWVTHVRAQHKPVVRCSVCARGALMLRPQPHTSLSLSSGRYALSSARAVAPGVCALPAELWGTAQLLVFTRQRMPRVLQGRHSVSSTRAC